ncbi:unnamed protein product [Chilo suppressalis]|uniref:Uncharacterized protein n=1 Tax=Chilo suppressalis TaxID=168631 RepID=A0ABN8B0T5_CHISP|nr:unnamed protein product [Chilo suppressalis]
MDRAKEVWWETYRRKRSRRMNMENILRKSAFDTAAEYTSHSSIAGVKEIFAHNIGHYRLAWIAAFSAMVVATCYFLVHIWSDTLTKPLIVTMESSTYPISEIDFPAIAICNINRISKKTFNKRAEMLWSRFISNTASASANQTFREFKKLYGQLGRLVDSTWTQDFRNHPFSVIFDHEMIDEMLLTEMKELAPSCSDMLLRCAWAGELVKCSDIFTVRRTVKGHCCAFNFILDYDSAGSPERTIASAKRQMSAGISQGLNFILDPMLDDYLYPLGYVPGFDLFLFDPTHFADPSGGRVIHRLIEPNQVMLLHLKSVKQYATHEVRRYPLETRKCLFHDEQKQFGNMYSYSACIINCRIRTMQSLCKCTPYYLPAGKGVSICHLDNLACLNKYKEKLLYQYPKGAETKKGLETETQDSMNCPECLPDCEFTQHYTRAFKSPMSLQLSNLSEFGNKDLKTIFRKQLDLVNKSIVAIFQPTDDCTLDRLDVISYWFEVVSNIGGFAGIFMGFSFVAIAEIIYFILIRFPKILYDNYMEYH